MDEVFPSPELPRESESAEPTSDDKIYLPTLRSGRLLPVKPLPEGPVCPEPAIAGSRGSGLLVSRGSFGPDDAVSVDPGRNPSTPDLMLVVEAASEFVGILEAKDGSFIPEVVVPVVLLPSPDVVPELGLVVEDRGSVALVPLRLPPRWLP